MSGKTTFKSIFTKGTKSDQMKLLERIMAEDEKEIENLGKLIDYINVVLGAIEIPKFKVKSSKHLALQTTTLLRGSQSHIQNGT
jgi:hypothetical protein